MRSILATTILLSTSALAQEQPDMLGVWNITVEGIDPHPQCGASIQTGVMDVERKITARAYRAKVRREDSYERCQGTGVSRSSATVRVKQDNLITIEYDEEGWDMHRLRLVDGIMTGKSGDGVSTRWERADDAAANAPTAEQLHELDAIIEEARPLAIDELNDEYFEKIWKALARSTQMEDTEAQQITHVMIERMTSCMMEFMRDFTVDQLTAAGPMLTLERAIIMFDPDEEEFIGTECVEDAAANSGIRLR